MSSIKKNFSYNLVYQILNLVILLVTSPYIARVLGPDKSGIYSYTYSVANFFLLAAMLGVNNYGNRSIALIRDDKEKLKYLCTPASDLGNFRNCLCHLFSMDH